MLAVQLTKLLCRGRYWCQRFLLGEASCVAQIQKRTGDQDMKHGAVQTGMQPPAADLHVTVLLLPPYGADSSSMLQQSNP